MKNLYIVTLKNRDDLNVVASSFESVSRIVAEDHGDKAILRIEFIEEVKER